MKRFATLAAVAAAGIAWTGTSLALSRKPLTQRHGTAGAVLLTPATSDEVIRWNQELLTLLQAPGAQPSTIHPTRTMAIVQLAIYDAVDAIEGGHRPYIVTAPAPGHASAPAAVAAAARTALLALLPGQQPAIDATYRSSLAELGFGEATRQGIDVGDRAASAILAARGNDGSAAPAPPFMPGSGPGAYQATPPTFSPPVFRQWPRVRPFALLTGDQFRPPPPPVLGSARYLDDWSEVKALGRSDSVSRSADRIQIGKFWGAAPIWIVWNQIAEMAAAGFHNTLAQNARLFALLDAGLADGVIALYDAKYAYNRWRPVTAITSLDTGNPAVIGDPTWSPLAATAPDPSYPGAHATVSEAAAVTLADFFGTDNFAFSLINAAMPGVVRSFSSFSQAADEASASRIFAGQHFRADEDAGQALGRQVGDFVTDNLGLATSRWARANRAGKGEHRHHRAHHQPELTP
jgi:PAP2 superfamily